MGAGTEGIVGVPVCSVHPLWENIRVENKHEHGECLHAGNAPQTGRDSSSEPPPQTRCSKDAETTRGMFPNFWLEFFHSSFKEEKNQ